MRKRCGNIATGNALKQSGESLALFQNMGIPKPVSIVFDDRSAGFVFGKYGKFFIKNRFTKKKTRKFAEKGTAMLLEDSVNSGPHSDRIFERYL